GTGQDVPLVPTFFSWHNWKWPPFAVIQRRSLSLIPGFPLVPNSSCLHHSHSLAVSGKNSDITPRSSRSFHVHHTHCSMWTARNANDLRRPNQVVSRNEKRPARPFSSQLTTGLIFTTQMRALCSALGRTSRSDSNLSVI